MTKYPNVIGYALVCTVFFFALGNCFRAPHRVLLPGSRPVVRLDVWEAAHKTNTWDKMER